MEDTHTKPTSSLSVIIGLGPNFTLEEYFEACLTSLQNLSSLSSAIPTDPEKLRRRAHKFFRKGNGVEHINQAASPPTDAGPSTDDKKLTLGLTYTAVQLEWFDVVKSIVALAIGGKACPASVIRWLAIQLHRTANQQSQLINWYMEADKVVQKGKAIKNDVVTVRGELKTWITDTVNCLSNNGQEVNNAGFARYLIEWGRCKFPDVETLQAYIQTGEPGFLTPPKSSTDAEPGAAPAVVEEEVVHPAGQPTEKINISKRDLAWSEMAGPVIASKLGLPNSVQSVTTWVVMESQAFFVKNPKKLEPIFRKQWNAASGEATLSIDYAIPPEIQPLHHKLQILAEEQKVSWSSLVRFCYLWVRDKFQDEQEIEAHIYLSAKPQQ